MSSPRTPPAVSTTKRSIVGRLLFWFLIIALVGKNVYKTCLTALLMRCLTQAY